MLLINALVLSTIMALFIATSIHGSGPMRVAAGRSEAGINAVEPTQTVSGNDALESLQLASRSVAQKVLPVVVEIDVVDLVKQQVMPFESPFDFFFGPQNDNKAPKEREFKRYGIGSGVIVRRTGNKVYVLTNSHVVGEADEISVKLNDRRQFKAKLVGKDEKRDLALVVFETGDTVPLAELGDSDQVQVGDLVFAVGNPMGFESTVTMGIVSAVGRKALAGTGIGNFTDYIQTDAAINQGNSGGALVDIKGRVIGINTWISSPSGGNVGLGFTIPINNARKAIEDFISGGRVEYGWLGVSIGNPSEEMRVDLAVGQTGGSLVYSVYRGSPADKAGMLPGDFIIRVNGEAVVDANNFLLMVANLPLNKAADFELMRYGKTLSVSVKIARRKEDKEIQEQARDLWPGLAVVKITEDIQRQLSLPKRLGNLVIANVDEGSPAAISGLKPGDVIIDIGGTETKSLIDFYRAVNDRKMKELLFRIYRQGNELIIGLVS